MQTRLYRTSTLKVRVACLDSVHSTETNTLFLEDLVGLKVSHDFEEMDEGDARILTLKDSRILDNEGELNSVHLIDPSLNVFLRGRASKRRNGGRRENEEEQ